MKRETQFFNIVVWGKTGENCSKYLSKGRSVHIEGRLQNRSYETQDKQKRTVTEIIAENVQFLGSPGGQKGPGGPEEGAPDYSPDAGDTEPSSSNPGTEGGDVPF